ncbi:MAG: hypothetical protein KC493_16160 [Bacteriovoracaceae bacterium]|nr:hypothetical protein [Bacteriovoracaceae bacterium]
MIKKIFKSEKGFTLAEVVVGAGLMGLVGLVIVNTMKTMGTQVKTTRKKNVRQLMMNTIVRYGNRAAQVVKREDFHNSKTYYNSSRTIFEPVATTYSTPSGKGLIEFEHQGTSKSLQGGSFEVKLSTIGNQADGSIKGTGAIISRCINESDRNSNFTLDQVYAINTVPVVRYEGANKVKKVFCCSRNNLDCSNQVTKGSSLRPRVFYVNERKVQMYPGPGQSHDVAGTGMNFYFDSASNPESYQLVLFAVENDCLQNDDKDLGTRECKNKNIVTIRIIEGMLASDIHDSGMLILGQ